MDEISRSIGLIVALRSRKPLSAVGEKMRWVLVTLIRVYRYLVSPWWPNACRFHPTCSQYAEDALREWGILKGLYLTLKRLLKCHPFHPGGFDPVPKGGSC